MNTNISDGQVDNAINDASVMLKVMRILRTIPAHKRRNVLDAIELIVEADSKEPATEVPPPMPGEPGYRPITVR